MYTLEEITSVEDQYRNGSPSLGRALAMLEARWQAGLRDEETALRLLFLLWYNITEPVHLTGLPVEAADEGRFAQVFEEAGGERGAGPLVLLAVGLMAEVFPWAIAVDEQRWTQISARLIAKVRGEYPEVSADAYAGRGAAGDYFQQMLSVRVRRA